MSEDLIAKLQRFTPRSAPDVAELLVRTGRESAERNRGWKWSTFALGTACSLLVAWTLAQPQSSTVAVVVSASASPAAPPSVSAGRNTTGPGDPSIPTMPEARPQTIEPTSYIALRSADWETRPIGNANDSGAPAADPVKPLNRRNFVVD